MTGVQARGRRGRSIPPGGATLAAIAGHLIPAAHGMPSAGDVVGEARLRFVLGARPDLAEPLAAALRPELGDDPQARLDDPRARRAGAPRRAGPGDRVRLLHRQGRPRCASATRASMAKTLYSWKPPRVHRGGPDRPGPRRRAPSGATPRPASGPPPRTSPSPEPRRRHDRRAPCRRRVARPVPRRLAPGLRRDPRDPRARDRPPAAHRPARDAGGRRPRRRRSPPRPSPAGPRRRTPSAPRSSAAPPRSTRRTARSSAPGPSARPARSTGRCTTSRTSRVAELHNAATLPSQPYGSLVPSVVPGRLSMTRRVPIGVIGAITPWNSPSVLGMRVVGPALALRQRGGPQARPPDRRSAAGRCSRRCSARPACPTGCSRSSSAARRRARRIVTDPNVHAVSFTGSTAAGRRVGGLAGRAAQEGVAGAGRQQRVRGARRRRPRRRRLGRGVRLVPVPGPGVLRRRAPHRPPQRRRSRTSSCWSRRRSRLRLGDPYREQVDLGPDRQREAARPGRRHRPALDRGRRTARRGRHPRRPVLPAHRARRRDPASTPPGPTRSSARSRRSSCSTTTRRRSPSPTTPSTGWPARSTRARSRAASRSPSGSGAAWSTSTTRP